jgi:hypothetical protein
MQLLSVGVRHQCHGGTAIINKNSKWSGRKGVRRKVVWIKLHRRDKSLGRGRRRNYWNLNRHHGSEGSFKSRSKSRSL